VLGDTIDFFGERQPGEIFWSLLKIAENFDRKCHPISESLSVLSAKIDLGCFSIDFAMFAAQEIQSADLVRELRFRLGLTQEQFAAELGVTFASINRWENRKVQPSPMALKLLRNRLEQMGDRGTDLLDRYF
jgi:putative transcriptional regulator